MYTPFRMYMYPSPQSQQNILLLAIYEGNDRPHPTLRFNNFQVHRVWQIDRQANRWKLNEYLRKHWPAVFNSFGTSTPWCFCNIFHFIEIHMLFSFVWKKIPTFALFFDLYSVLSPNLQQIDVWPIYPQ